MLNALLLSVKDILRLPEIRMSTIKIWRRNFLYFQRNIFLSLFWIIFEPLMYFIAFGYGISHMVENVNGMPYWIFFSPTVIVFTTMLIPFYETSFGFFNKIKKGGVYECFSYMPLKNEEIFTAEILWGTTKGFVSATILLGIFFSFGFIHRSGVLLILPVLLISSWLFSALGLLISTTINDPKKILYFQMGIILPMTLFCGTFFPFNVYPETLEQVVYILPLTSIIEQTRALSTMQLSSSSGFLTLLYPIILAVIFTNWGVSRANRFLENQL